MAKEAPGHAHNISRLNIIFAFSSIALFLSTIGLVWFDYAREWKDYQRQFVELERQTTAEKLGEAERRVNQREIQRVEEELDSAVEELSSRDAVINELEDQRATLSDQWKLADIRERELKARYDSVKFFYEEGDNAPLGKRVTTSDFRSLEAEFIEARQIRISLDYEIDGLVSKLREHRSRVTSLNSEMEVLNQEATLLRRKQSSIAESFPNTFRNLPMVDFIDPTIEIKQVLVQNVTEELNFTQVPRIDRCMTCHLGIDNPDYEDAVQPFTTHPNLDLFVDPESAHPVDVIGCTSCHEGRGRATDFVGVNHTPQNKEQRRVWEEKYGWKEDHYWDKPMYASGNAEAGCLRCHRDEVLIPGGEKFNRSRFIYELSGCYGCHNTDGFEDRRNRGPKLDHIVSKTTPEFAARWIQNPKSFKASTFMPRFWNLDNNLDEEQKERNDTEVASIVAFVFGASDPLSYGSIPRGDVRRGEALVSEIGCLGCHIIDEVGYEDVDLYRRRGPALAGLGSKVNAEFLYNWVKNPRHYWEETYMPSLRLTNGEAADATSYLMSLRNESFESQLVPEASAEALDEITVEFLRTGLPDAQAREELLKMSADEKMLYSGEKLILRYGCFGCHDIKGFENAQKIGVDLSTWGSKMVTRLDFGHVDIEHSREAWLKQKLRAPRIYDGGKVKTPPEKLRMGYFSFTDREIDDIARNVLGQVRDEYPQEGVKTLNENEAFAERALSLVHDYNCRGCHIVDGFGGAIYEAIDDTGMRPPNLNTQGARTQPNWLFHFFKEPSEVRFWLNVRMPTFQFSDNEANTLVQGFMAMDETQPFASSKALPADPETVRIGRYLLEKNQCERCHIAEAAGTMEASQLAPSFRLTGERLREEWLVEWMKDPQSITPGTQMPQLWPVNDEGDYEVYFPDVLDGDAEAQMRAVGAYLMRYNR